MKILIAPDSFKGSLTAPEAARIIEAAAIRVLGCETIVVPVADGGEGTLEVIVDSAGGETVGARVTNPLGGAIDAEYGLIDDGATAVVEMARASGLGCVDRLDPIVASSRGTGELIAHARSRGARRFLIAIGGSATNDGGMGMLSALGARFYDDGGRLLAGSGGDLEAVACADLTDLAKHDLTVICDVNNPLTGETGATHVYAAQKGADAAMRARLERGMRNYESVLRGAGCPSGDFPGAGAAGGAGYALIGVMGAHREIGIDAVLDAVRFDALLDGVDLVVTGEGKLDGQSVQYGKAPTGIARRCGARGIPVVALAGGLGEGAHAYLDLPHTAMMPIIDAPRTLESAIAHAAQLLESAAERLFYTIKIGIYMQARIAGNDE
ncbi:MAG: glycerate kinase [Christensenellales bacterium]|jgi:glycerate kinase